MNKRSHIASRRTLGVCVVVVVLIVGIAIAAFRVSGTSSIRSDVSTTTLPLTTTKIISALSSQLPARYIFLRPMTPITQTNVGYQVPGDNFQVVLPTTAPSLAYSDVSVDNEQATYSDLNKAAAFTNHYLNNHGFSSTPGEDQASGLLSAVYLYERSDAICQVSVYVSLSITCSPAAQLVATAAQAQSLVAVYNKAAPNSGPAVIANPKIQASKTSGYTIATLLIYNNHGETSANFYKQGVDAWQIVNLGWYNDPHEDANIIPNCADFESYTPVREAFAGQACYDSATRITRAIGR